MKLFVTLLLVLAGFSASAQNTVVKQTNDIYLVNDSTNAVAFKVIKPPTNQAPYITLGTQTNTYFSVSSTGAVVAASFAGDGSQLTGISGGPGGSSNFNPTNFYTNGASQVTLNNTNLSIFGITNYGDITVSDGSLVLTNTGTSAAIRVTANGDVDVDIMNGDLVTRFSNGGGIRFGNTSGDLIFTNFGRFLWVGMDPIFGDSSTPAQRYFTRAVDLLDLGGGPDPVNTGIYGTAAGDVAVAGDLQLDNEAVAETPTASHTLIIKDSTGQAYRILAVPVP